MADVRYPPIPNWPGSGGEMGALIRAFDRSATSLGPIERWPRSPRTPDYARAPDATNPGAASIVKAPSHEIAGVRGTVPIRVRHDLTPARSN